ncbi:MAG: M50 family metallopeptidase, partial [Acidimicrobiales bacterium]
MSQTSEHTTPDTPPPDPDDTTATPPGKAWRRLLAMAAITGVIVLLAIQAGSFPAVVFVFAIVASVTLHEAGHYLVAKKTGMKATEFFFGFGPRLWSFRRGETEYGIKAIPAGGYVKVLGMSTMEQGIDPADESRTYRAQSYPKRVALAAAGVLTQFVIAFILLVFLWTVVGVPVGRPTLEVGSISRLDSGPSPAQSAGFKVGDKIVSVDGRPADRWQDLPPYIRERPNQPITFVVERNGEQVTLVATPAATNPDGEPVGFVGIGPEPEVETANPVTAVGRSASDLWGLTQGSVKALGAFVSPSALEDYGNQLSGEPSSPVTDETRPVSVVGVVRIADQAADRGMFEFLSILVLLNVFLGVLNLVPLLPLDGGHIAVATYERLRSRKG